MGGGLHGPAAEAFLTHHAELARRRIEDLDEDRPLHQAHLRWRRWSDRMRGAMQALILVGALAAVAVAGGWLWRAHSAHGLLVEAMSIPPARPADSYASNWGDDITLEIPETGVSVPMTAITTPGSRPGAAAALNGAPYACSLIG
ncbi:MAG: hypothetical protein JWP35_1568 [Caulobacter sp.]|nr:hypothetical protein [Caulobacter sp.]